MFWVSRWEFYERIQKLLKEKRDYKKNKKENKYGN